MSREPARSVSASDALTLLLFVCVVAIAFSADWSKARKGRGPADLAGWQLRVIEETKQFNPELWAPGTRADLIRFGYRYVDEHDRRRHGDGIDHAVVAKLRGDLIDKGVPIDSASGVMFLDMMAAYAHEHLCRE